MKSRMFSYLPLHPPTPFLLLSGFNFTSENHKRMSYWQFLHSMGLLRREGTPISFDVWQKSSFFLIFKTSFELENYSGLVHDRIIQTPYGANQPYNLYIRFKTPTTHVLRATVLYRVPRTLQINSLREGFLSHGLEQ